MTTLSDDCRASLYRIIWKRADGSVRAFALESTREAVRRFLETAIALSSPSPPLCWQIPLTWQDSHGRPCPTRVLGLSKCARRKSLRAPAAPRRARAHDGTAPGRRGPPRRLLP